MDINQAHRVIQAEAEKLTAALQAKGYVTSTAEIWIARRGSDAAVIYVSERPADMNYVPGHDNIAEAISKTADAIDALPDRRAYDVDFAGPLVLMSEQHAQAAE